MYSPENYYIFAEISHCIGIFMHKVGEIIKQRRKEFGLTQSQLAKLAKVGINTLTQIEKGEGNPTIAVLDRVLGTLGLQLTVTTIEV